MEKARQEKIERERALQRRKAEEAKRKKELKRQMLEEIEEQKRTEFAAEQHLKVRCDVVPSAYPGAQTHWHWH